MILAIGQFTILSAGLKEQVSLFYSGIVNDNVYVLGLRMGYTYIPLYFPIIQKQIRVNDITFNILSVKENYIELEKVSE